MTAKTYRLRRTLAAASVALGLIGGLASCAADPEISADASAAYRAQVATIAQHSVAEDYDAALAELDALAAEVDAAVAAGTLDEARAGQIREAIDRGPRRPRGGRRRLDPDAHRRARADRGPGGRSPRQQRRQGRQGGQGQRRQGQGQRLTPALTRCAAAAARPTRQSALGSTIPPTASHAKVPVPSSARPRYVTSSATADAVTDRCPARHTNPTRRPRSRASRR